MINHLSVVVVANSLHQYFLFHGVNKAITIFDYSHHVVKRHLSVWKYLSKLYLNISRNGSKQVPSELSYRALVYNLRNQLKFILNHFSAFNCMW